ncbi:MAG: hypothetical protein R6V10_08135 [bacterium]
MKGSINIILAGFLVLFVGMFSGCFQVEDDDDDTCCDSGGCAVVEEWHMVGPAFHTLSVGDDCGCGGCSDCSWYEEVGSWDTLVFSGDHDYNLVDLRFNYTVTNWGDYTTSVWVSLCDYYGCEDVLYMDIPAGEVISGREINPVLDTALTEFYDCLDLYGSACYMEYDVDVYLGEECTCSDVTLDYFYDGLYVY